MVSSVPRHSQYITKISNAHQIFQLAAMRCLVSFTYFRQINSEFLVNKISCKVAEGIIAAHIIARYLISLIYFVFTFIGVAFALKYNMFQF